MKKAGKKRVTTNKILAKKKSTRKKGKVETKAGGKKPTNGKTAGPLKKRIREESHSLDMVTVALEDLEIISGEQSGDLQGLSNVECASSENVDELLEEGNAFEAEVVMGVEDAEDADEVEVRTHEVPQDHVPAEYLDKEG